MDLTVNKINYQLELDKLLKDINKGGSVPSLLLHSCCGPCSSYVCVYLAQYFNITVFYCNPNIYPEEEYNHRLSEQRRIIDAINADYDGTLHKISLIDAVYDHNEFLDSVQGLENEREGGKRCSECFRLRLRKTYDLAKEHGFDYFATTLTVSPHKNAMIINAIGEEICSSYAGLEINSESESDSNSNSKSHLYWLPSDFKKREGYKQSIELSKKYDLYRQNYCGCEFSIY